MLRTSTTVEKARKIVGQAAGRSKKEDQLKLMNEVRQWIYANQIEWEIDLSVPFLVDLEVFQEEGTPYEYQYDSKRRGSSHHHKDGYCHENKYCRYGFRLPPNFLSIKAMDIDGIPTVTKSCLRSPYDGITSPGSRLNVIAYDGGNKPLERDLSKPAPITFVANTTEPQKMIVTGQTDDGIIQEVTYYVTSDKQVSDQIWSVIQQVYFPEPTKSVVRIFQGKRELARYPEGTIVPMFRQYLLDGYCPTKCSTILVKGNRQFEDLTDDDELVEFGESLIWQNLARAINMLNKADKDQNDRENMALWQQAAISQIRASAQVEDGQSMEYRVKRKPLNRRTFLG